MILGAIVGHGNAIVNPLLYGVQLFRLMGSTEGNDDKQKSKELMDVEDPKIDTDAANNRRIVGWAIRHAKILSVPMVVLFA